MNALEKLRMTPRMRIMVDNDYNGDPDGLVQLVHHLLSLSSEIVGIVGSHLRPNDPFDGSTETATHAIERVNEVLELLNMKGKVPVFQGTNCQMKDRKTPIDSAAVDAIIKEAMRDDVKTPFYYCAGGGLTEIASAWLKEPKIAERLTLVWIGGTEYPELAFSPPNYTTMEYNTNIDLIAAQVVFNDSTIPIWQVPRNVYRQTLMGYSEMVTRIKPQGKIGAYLFEKIDAIIKQAGGAETYIMGDSPLVLLTSLQSIFESDPSSCHYVLRRSPLINSLGIYEQNNEGRNIRVYNRLDVRLMLDDFIAKLTLFNTAA